MDPLPSSQVQLEYSTGESRKADSTIEALKFKQFVLYKKVLIQFLCKDG